MLSFLPGPVLGVLSLLLLVANTMFWFPFVVVAALFKLVVPWWRWRLVWGAVTVFFADCWIACNNAMLGLTQKISWDVQRPDSLEREGWYLVCCNHRSWIDIVVLQRVLQRRVPFLRFFLKQELMWVPLLGIAWWALDYPYMKRYPSHVLEKKPHLRGKDLETTRRACEKFRYVPASVVNFLEGTRFTPAKCERQQSPYRHLLRPKAGGIAFALGAMGERFTSVLDVTLFYPDGPVELWDLLSGRVRKIIVRIDEVSIPERFRGADYLNDGQFREDIQAWCRELWRAKDARIETILSKTGDSARRARLRRA